MAHLIQQSSKAATEKSNFAQTCNLLSRYMKERVSFGAIGHGISSNPEPNKVPETVRTPATTLNLLPGIENPSEKTNSASIKPVDFLPQLVPNFTSSTPVENSSNKTSDLRKSSAPMTIFYNGQVMVFDDFPAEKIKEIVALATKTTSNNVTNGFTTTTSVDKPNSNSNVPPAPKTKVMKGIQLQSQADSDLPIARRASLHRFLEKRKDRVASKAPYQINNPSTPSSSSARPRPTEQRDIVIIDLECQPSKDSIQHFDLSL